MRLPVNQSPISKPGFAACFAHSFTHADNGDVGPSERFIWNFEKTHLIPSSRRSPASSLPGTFVCARRGAYVNLPFRQLRRPENELTATPVTTKS